MGRRKRKRTQEGPSEEIEQPGDVSGEGVWDGGEFLSGSQVGGGALPPPRFVGGEQEDVPAGEPTSEPPSEPPTPHLPSSPERRTRTRRRASERVAAVISATKKGGMPDLSLEAGEGEEDGSTQRGRGKRRGGRGGGRRKGRGRQGARKARGGASAASKRGFSAEARAVFEKWLGKHLDEPYPEEMDVVRMAEKADVTPAQVLQWFINARRRHPLLVNRKFKRCRRKYVFITGPMGDNDDGVTTASFSAALAARPALSTTSSTAPSSSSSSFSTKKGGRKKGSSKKSAKAGDGQPPRKRFKKRQIRRGRGGTSSSTTTTTTTAATSAKMAGGVKPSAAMGAIQGYARAAGLVPPITGALPRPVQGVPPNMMAMWALNPQMMMAAAAPMWTSNPMSSFQRQAAMTSMMAALRQQQQQQHQHQHQQPQPQPQPQPQQLTQQQMQIMQQMQQLMQQQQQLKQQQQQQQPQQQPQPAQQQGSFPTTSPTAFPTTSPTAFPAPTLPSLPSSTVGSEGIVTTTTTSLTSTSTTAATPMSLEEPQQTQPPQAAPQLSQDATNGQIGTPNNASPSLS